MAKAGDLQGKVALVTGAAGGQGRSHVDRFLAEGVDVIATDLREADSPEPEVTEGGARLLRASCDVCDSAGLKALVERGVEQLGPLDIVVANAGITGTRQPAAEIADEEWERVIGIDLTGTWKTVKAATPALNEGGASVILIGSTSGVKGYALTAHYAAAKHGLVGLTRVLSAELAPRGIRVNIIHPTVVDTEMVHTKEFYEAFVPPGQEPTRENFEQVSYGFHQLPMAWMDPSDVTEAVLWLASDRSRFVTGTELVLDGGALQ